MAEERLWPTDPAPAGTDQSDAVTFGISLGTVFVVGTAGTINGAFIRVSDTPPGGTCRLLLFVNGLGVVANEIITIGPGGWTRFDFTTPVAVVANDICIIYYNQLVNGGVVRYTFTNNIFAIDVDSANLHAPDTTEASGLGIGVAGNGVFLVDEVPTDIPINTFNASSYWVDPIFEEAAPPEDLSAIAGGPEMYWTPSGSALLLTQGSVVAVVTADGQAEGIALFVNAGTTAGFVAMASVSASAGELQTVPVAPSGSLYIAFGSPMTHAFVTGASSMYAQAGYSLK